MRKALVYITLTLLSLLSLQSRAQGVSFYDGTVYEALAEAKRCGKLLLVEFYADWDHSSRWMHEVVSNSNELEDWFIASSLNTNEAENAGLAQVYQVTNYPSLVIFSNTGDVIDKLTRAMDSGDFNAYLRQVRIQNEDSFRDVKNIIYLAKDGKKASSSEVNTLIDKYVTTADSEILTSSSAWELFTLEGYSAYGTTLYRYLVEHTDEFYDSELAETRAQQLYFEAIMPFISGIASTDSRLQEFKKDTLSTKKIKGAEELIQLYVYRSEGLPVEFLQALENTLGNISQTIDYQLILSVEFIIPLLGDEQIATKRKARQVLEEYLKYCTSPSKITIIESLLEKFS